MEQSQQVLSFILCFLLLQFWMIFLFIPTITLHGIVLLCKGTAW